MERVVGVCVVFHGITLAFVFLSLRRSLPLAAGHLSIGRVCGLYNRINGYLFVWARWTSINVIKSALSKIRERRR